MVKSGKKRVTLTLKEETYLSLESAADSLGLGMSQFVEIILSSLAKGAGSAEGTFKLFTDALISSSSFTEKLRDLDNSLH